MKNPTARVAPDSGPLFASRRRCEQLRHHARDTQQRGELADELVLVARNRLQVQAGRRGAAV